MRCTGQKCLRAKLLDTKGLLDTTRLGTPKYLVQRAISPELRSINEILARQSHESRGHGGNVRNSSLAGHFNLEAGNGEFPAGGLLPAIDRPVHGNAAEGRRSKTKSGASKILCGSNHLPSGSHKKGRRQLSEISRGT